MQWYEIPKEEPSVIFPEGAILEDDKGIYKVLKPVEKQKVAHCYTVEMLQEKIPISQDMKPFVDTKKMTFVVFAQNLDKIKRIQ